MVVAGPLAEWIIAALENAPIFSCLSPMGAGLYSIGIARDAIAECEAALAAGKPGAESARKHKGAQERDFPLVPENDVQNISQVHSRARRAWRSFIHRHG